MEIFRELLIQSDDVEQLDKLMDEVGVNPSAGWVRDQSSELIREYHGSKPGRSHFRSEGCDRFPACDLILTRLGPNSLEVSNIMPRGDGHFDISDFNFAIQDFAEKVIRPFAEKMGMIVELSTDQFDLNLWMTEGAARKLRVFSRSANKGVGGAAPADSARWLDFVVTAHREGCWLPPEMLRRWLVEDEGWYFDVADRLAGEYAFGGEVLTFAETQPV